ncbi:MAG: XRE family transcriptional regulator [Dehalococcoidia bacterium]|nr:MAG: XRE family transcriptional regulator [Dehalococcoidia bacterium]
MEMTSHRERAFRQEVGRRLRTRRESLGLTQEEIAWEAGVAQGSISHYEQGKSEIPLGVLIEICRRFGVSPLEIVPSLGTAAPEPGFTARAS